MKDKKQLIDIDIDDPFGLNPPALLAGNPGPEEITSEPNGNPNAERTVTAPPNGNVSLDVSTFRRTSRFSFEAYIDWIERLDIAQDEYKRRTHGKKLNTSKLLRDVLDKWLLEIEVTVQAIPKD